MRQKCKSHDGGLCLPLENAVESATNPAGVRYHWSLGSHPSPSHRQMLFPPVKPAEVWAEEDATDTLPTLQEWTWDDDSIITRGRVSRRERSAGIGWTLGGVGSTRPAKEELGEYS